LFKWNGRKITKKKARKLICFQAQPKINKPTISKEENNNNNKTKEEKKKKERKKECITRFCSRFFFFHNLLFLLFFVFFSFEKEERCFSVSKNTPFFQSANSLLCLLS
jgi:hypothetical protein